MARKREPDVLTGEHYDAIQDARQKIAAAEALMPRCEACEIDTSEYAKIIDMAKAKYDKIEKAWFPRGRPK